MGPSHVCWIFPPKKNSKEGTQSLLEIPSGYPVPSKAFGKRVLQRICKLEMDLLDIDSNFILA